MVTITRALQLIYDYTEQQAQEFIKQHALQDDHPNPFVEIEERISQTKTSDYDWYFCQLCLNYEVLHFDRVYLSEPTCTKCGGKMI